MERVILASQSPRRRELLGKMGVEFSVQPSNFNEQLDDTRSPEEVAVELALGKAANIAVQNEDAIVIASDTIVTFNGKQLEKPKDEDEARKTLHMLAGRTNIVTTSLVVMCIDKGIELKGSDSTRVQFKPLNEKLINAYVESGDPMDKAGSYGIQSGGSVLIESIEGNYDTVIGLPTKLLKDFLSQCGIAAQSVELESPVHHIPA